RGGSARLPISNLRWLGSSAAHRRVFQSTVELQPDPLKNFQTASADRPSFFLLFRTLWPPAQPDPNRYRYHPILCYCPAGVSRWPALWPFGNSDFVLPPLRSVERVLP